MKPDRALKDKLDAIVGRTIAEGRAQVESLIASVVGAGGTSEEALVGMLYDRRLEPELRASICWMMPRLNIAGAGSMLELLMSDPSEKIREEAATGLGLVLHDDSVDVLLQVLERDSSRSVRLAALHALGISSSSRAVTGMMKVLQDPGEDEEVRADAAEALAHFEDEGVVDALLDCLEDTSPWVRYSAAYALGEQGDMAALPKLTGVAAHDHAVTPWGSVASSAARAIEALKDRSS